jgi:hypothetical protein
MLLGPGAARSPGSSLPVKKNDERRIAISRKSR